MSTKARKQKICMNRDDKKMGLLFYDVQRRSESDQSKIRE